MLTLGVRGGATAPFDTSLIYKCPRGASGHRADLYRNSYRILKKLYNSNKTFETSLTTIRRSRYDLDKITRTAPASRNLSYHNRMTVPEKHIPLLMYTLLPED